MPMLTNMTASTSATSMTLASQRQTMVDCQIRTFDVTDQIVLDRFLAIPRESYVPGKLTLMAYSDAPLDIVSVEGEVRSLLSPMVLARMVQGAGVKADDRILDVAGGAGYTAAILAGLGKSVVALESISSLSALAGHQLALAGLNATAVCGPLDGRSGIDGIFDLIFVNGAVEDSELIYKFITDRVKSYYGWYKTESLVGASTDSFKHNMVYDFSAAEEILRPS